jgi:predicted acetylornithine/succinylornithine family transaminase
MSKFETIKSREQKVFMPAVRRWPVALVRGQGSRVWDSEGHEFIDLTAGWGVNSIGHCHPALVEALHEQARTLMQTTNIVYTEPQLELAERLDRITPDPIHRSFFTSSGTEANEGALKLAHRATGRSLYVSTLNSFHGRTLGAMSVLGQTKYRERWTGIIRENRFVPYGDIDAAKAALGLEVAAFVVEPVQGEGGVNVPPEDYLPRLAEACHQVGALLILDEVQTCMGRTGRWLAREWSGVVPDILTLGKGIGGGLPLAAFMASEAVMQTVEPGDHGGTYAGNPLMCRAGVTVMRVIEADGLVARSAKLGATLGARLEAFAKRASEHVEASRGLGLLRGVALREPELAQRVHLRLIERGVLVNLTADRVLRLFPALNIPEDELDRAVEVLERTIEQA